MRGEKAINKTVCVLGLGYIGLPTACLLAKAGYQVLGVDIDKDRIKKLKRGHIPFEEPGLVQLFQKAKKKLKFSSSPEKADTFIICVPTPLKKNKKPNLNYVKQAAKDISNVLNKNNLVIIESTIPPEATKKIIYPLLSGRSKIKKFYLSHAPERAIPGKTLKEMIESPRVIGGIDKQSGQKTKKIYSSFVKGKIFLTDSTTAETVKLLENTYRDINIAFANETAKLCDSIKINVWEIIALSNLHPRVNFHQPGPGVGGHCIAIDPWFLVRQDGIGNVMIKSGRRINDSMPDYVIKSAATMLKQIKQPTITILGVSYKANIDDWRETPALKIIKLAKKRGWKVKIYDPLVKDFPLKIENNFKKATNGSDCLLIITDHSFCTKMKPKDIKNMRNKNIFDCRNCISKEKWQAADFKVKILGSPC